MTHSPSSPSNQIAIREAHPDDAMVLLSLGRALLGETDFFLRLPAERAESLDDMRRVIRYYAAMPSALMLTAWDGDTPVGEGILSAGSLARSAHIGTLGIGVLKSHWGLGVGQALMAALEETAHRAVLERLEFTVLAHNLRARAFYTAQGYREEGLRSRSVRYGPEGPDGAIRYGDEIVMAKWIGPTDCISVAQNA